MDAIKAKGKVFLSFPLVTCFDKCLQCWIFCDKGINNIVRILIEFYHRLLSIRVAWINIQVMS